MIKHILFTKNPGWENTLLEETVTFLLVDTDKVTFLAIFYFVQHGLFPTQDSGDINYSLLPHTILNLTSKEKETVFQQCNNF